MDYILETENVTFLDIITFPDVHIEEGKFTFITGPSGAGKSTLLKLFNATLIPSSGKITYRGQDIKTLDAISYRKKVLLSTQNVFLIEGTIEENFQFYYEAREEASPLPEVMQSFLQVCQLNFSPETNCALLSGGERQRVFLAICLSFMPDVLLLDEPTAALDEHTAEQLFRSLKSFCRSRDITPLVISHAAELVDTFADAIIDISKGKTDE